MASSNNLDVLSADGELPFGHPGPRSDDTPEGFSQSPPVDQGPELDYTPDEDGGVVHRVNLNSVDNSNNVVSIRLPICKITTLPITASLMHSSHQSHVYLLRIGYHVLGSQYH